jgi:hypothetical protein
MNSICGRRLRCDTTADEHSQILPGTDGFKEFLTAWHQIPFHWNPFVEQAETTVLLRCLPMRDAGFEPANTYLLGECALLRSLAAQWLCRCQRTHGETLVKFPDEVVGLLVT